MNTSYLTHCYTAYAGEVKEYDVVAVLGYSRDLRKPLLFALVGDHFNVKFQRWLVRDFPTKILSLLHWL
jgi:hypothetical protein